MRPSTTWRWALGAVAIAGAAIVAIVWPPAAGPPVVLELEHGASLGTIGARLERADLVRSRSGFVWVARLMGAERELRAGRYELPRGVAPWTLVGLLRAGVIELHQVTVPEGLTIWEIAGRLAAAAAIDSVRFVALATDSLVAARLGVPSSNLEGYLYPDTYDVPVQQDAAELIARMTGLGLRALDEEYRAHPGARLSPSEVMILASIVEAEARVAAEQPRIAAVYLNRLRRGWRLEADPTVLYALGERRRLLYADLEIESAWNTYRVSGLPPTPICSPGRGAIRAVLEPDPGRDELYFVARGDGTHRFSRTLAEHERARREVARRRRQAQP